jgi:Flp pilus assembly protein TadB
MGMTTLAAALLGGLAGLGALIAVAGWLGTPVRDERASRRGRGLDQLNLRLGLAVAAAVLVGALTRWPVAMAAAALFGWTAPTLLGARARRRREAERTEAVARWAEQLRDTMTAAAGLHEAIGVTARVAPLPIRSEVQELAARLRRVPLADAARHFSAAIGNAAGDQVAVALILASERHGARLAEVLGRVAAATRAEAALHLRIEAQRARTYSQARLISGVIAGVVAVYVVLNREYLAPFATVSGQLVLALVCGLWFASLWALVRLAEVASGERLLGQVAALGPTEAGR